MATRWRFVLVMFARDIADALREGDLRTTGASRPTSVKTPVECGD